MNQNATQNAETAEENAERKKKKRKRRRRRRDGDQLKPTQAAPDPGRRHRPQSRWDPGRAEPRSQWTQVAPRPSSLHGEPKSHRDPGRAANPGRRTTVSGVFFFFSFFSDEHVGAALVVFFVFFLNVNRVLETRFSYRCHVEKVPHQTQTTHKNWTLEARFRAQNRAFEARVAKNPYSL